MARRERSRGGAGHTACMSPRTDVTLQVSCQRSECRLKANASRIGPMVANMLDEIGARWRRVMASALADAQVGQRFGHNSSAHALIASVDLRRCEPTDAQVRWTDACNPPIVRRAHRQPRWRASNTCSANRLCVMIRSHSAVRCPRCRRCPRPPALQAEHRCPRPV